MSLVLWHVTDAGRRDLTHKGVSATATTAVGYGIQGRQMRHVVSNANRQVDVLADPQGVTGSQGTKIRTRRTKDGVEMGWR